MYKASLRRYVRKSGVSFIAIKVVGGLFSSRKPIEPRTIHNKNIQMAILIVVPNGNTAAGAFKDIFLSCIAAVDYAIIQAHHRRHVHKPDLGGPVLNLPGQQHENR